MDPIKVTTRSQKPFYSESIRIDMKYFRDGSYEWRIMQPDRRKRNKLAQKVKWEWAIGNGYDWDIRKWDNKDLIRSCSVLGALASHFTYMKRCLLHDFVEPNPMRRWIKRMKPRGQTQ